MNETLTQLIDENSVESVVYAIAELCEKRRDAASSDEERTGWNAIAEHLNAAPF